MNHIRPEQTGDEETIYEVTQAAFAGRAYAGGDEGDVINALRRAGALSLSLVMERAGEIIGQVTFSPAQSADGSEGWYALGPVAIAPDFQSQGLGAELINYGLDEISKVGALGCMLTGNPVYYQRFGFDFAAELCPENEPVEFFMIKYFGKARPKGPMAFHRAFYQPSV